MKFFNKQILFFSGIIIIIIILIPILIEVYWEKNTPEDFFFTGFLQSDQITYTALFRSVFERGNGFSYSYPYANPGAENPPVIFQIPFTLLAWLWKLSGGSLIIPWEIVRIIFGVGFFILLFIFASEVLRLFYPKKEKCLEFQWYIFLFFLILATGGGVAWFISLIKYNIYRFTETESLLNYMEVFTNVEESYHWWFLNIFRNIFYPLEMEYHFFFFLAIVGVIKKMPVFVLLGQIMACMSGVFVGIEISTILIVYFLLESLIQRKKEIVIHLLGSILIFLIFIYYYKIFLSRFPVAKSLVEQHKTNIHLLIPIREYISAYGILLILVPLIFLLKKTRNTIFNKDSGRLLIIWLIVVISLMLNDKWLGKRSIQPPHFTRGYLYTVLLTISAVGIFPYWEKLLNRQKKSAFVILLFAFLIFIPDNVLFVIEQLSEQPHLFVLSIPKETKEALDFLNSIPEREVAFSPERRFGDQIPAFSPHNSTYAQIYATAFDDEKTFTDKDFTNFVKEYSISLVVLPKIYIKYFYARGFISDKWKLIFENSMWSIYRPP